ncbi:GNAT family N-acetyltransferase [candidate division KSB1 bacterium]|nr:GNAT family N-acetyltransferase [candidate division KSB1 bacterium]
MPLYRHATHRLDLIAATPEHVLAELESPAALGNLLHADVSADWPPGEYDRGAQEFFRDRLQEGGEEVIGWYGWYAIRRTTIEEPAVVVAAGGYFGPPDENGDVEIGYSVVPSFRKQGYATEIVAALVHIAFADLRVHCVIARTGVQNQASIKVLQNAGFRQSGSPDDEGNIRFELLRKEQRI